MSNNNTHSVLFELQKNLEDLSSAKEQVDFFRDKSLEITDGISEVQHKYVEHLKSIKTDYQNRVNDLKIELASFLSKTAAENFKSIQKVVDKSGETIGKGIEKFETVSQKVESSNNEKIEAIKSLLEHYKSVVEAGNFLIETLTAIDFPTKLSKIDSNIKAVKTALSETKQSIEKKATENQILVNQQINEARQLIDKNAINHHTKIIQRLDQQGKEIKSLKTFFYIILGLITFGTVATIILFKLRGFW